jgi:hypothetical protein
MLVYLLRGRYPHASSTPVNLPTRSPIPKSFMTEWVVLEELAEQEPGATQSGASDPSNGAMLVLFLGLESKATSGPSAAPQALGARCASSHLVC